MKERGIEKVGNSQRINKVIIMCPKHGAVESSWTELGQGRVLVS